MTITKKFPIPGLPGPRGRPGLHRLRRIVTAVLVASACVCAPPKASAQPVFNVKDFGAAGDGTTIDTPAIDSAIEAANAAGGGIVEFPRGTYLSVSIHLKNDVTLQLDADATIAAALTGFDAPEPNPFSRWQDFGHSHFHNALIVGEYLQNIGLIGTGTIDGNHNLTTGNPPSGRADKAISLKLCANVVISDITITRGGHFAILANGIDTMTVTRAHILNANARDGFNLINSSHVTIADSIIEGDDDAMVLKSDYALGFKGVNEDIHITNCTIRSGHHNATQFGSETCGDFSNVSFSHVTVTGAGKAGIGITSNDGSVIDGVTYDDFTMSGTTVPIWIKTGNRARCPDNPPKGIIRNIRIGNVTAVQSFSTRGEITSTISGLADVPVENIAFTNIDLRVPGRHPESDTDIVPPETNDWQPAGQGTKPSYGWWLRHVRNITFTNCQVSFDSDDGRPAVIAEDGESIVLDTFTADRGSTSIYDLGFSGVSSYCVTNSSATDGSDLIINAVDSTMFCDAPAAAPAREKSRNE